MFGKFIVASVDFPVLPFHLSLHDAYLVPKNEKFDFLSCTFNLIVNFEWMMYCSFVLHFLMLSFIPLHVDLFSNVDLVMPPVS